MSSLEYRLFCEALRCIVRQRGQYVLGNTVFLQPNGCQRQIRQMSLREIGSEIGSRLRDRTFKKSLSVQVEREKEGGTPCLVVRQGGVERGSRAEEAVALLQRKEIYPLSPSTALSATCRPFTFASTRG